MISMKAIMSVDTGGGKKISRSLRRLPYS
jgi:hypothetical protein